MEAKLKDRSASLFVRNIQLGLFGCITSLIVSYFNNDLLKIIYLIQQMWLIQM